MQIVKIMGGLGNQMFGYAFALALRTRGREVKLDNTWYERNQGHNGWELDRVFRLDIPACTIAERDSLADLDPRFASRLRRKLFGVRRGHFVERRRGFDRRFFDIDGDAYLDGFWQSPLYHEGIEAEIAQAFSFPSELETEGIKRLMEAEGRCLIGVHVRRGDYLGSAALSEVCGEAYYRAAIETLLEGARDPLVLFFSDDLEWCERQLAGGLDAIFVDWNRGPDSWRDMRLMTRCDRLALANSSFSWWGARLGRASETSVVAPSRWFGPGVPDNTEIKARGWIQLDPRGERAIQS